MGRPRQYATPAERQAACRRRRRAAVIAVDRPVFEQIEAGWVSVQDALAPLARRGDPLAVQLWRAPITAGLARLAAWFQAQAAEREAG